MEKNEEEEQRNEILILRVNQVPRLTPNATVSKCAKKLMMSEQRTNNMFRIESKFLIKYSGMMCICTLYNGIQNHGDFSVASPCNALELVLR